MERNVRSSSDRSSDNTSMPFVCRSRYSVLRLENRDSTPRSSRRSVSPMTSSSSSGGRWRNPSSEPSAANSASAWKRRSVGEMAQELEVADRVVVGAVGAQLHVRVLGEPLAQPGEVLVREEVPELHDARGCDRGPEHLDGERGRHL